MKIRSEEGFSLLELVIVIVCIVILSVVAIPKVVNLQDSAMRAACIQNQCNLESSCAMYFVSSVGSATPNSYPDELADLIPDYFTKLPVCPETNKDYEYDRATYEVRCTLSEHRELKN